MLPAQRALGTKIAANAVGATLTSFIAVPLVLLSSPAYAYPVPHSQREYEQYVYEATTIVNQAREALAQGELTYQNNVARVQNAVTSIIEKTALLDQATVALHDTQSRYDTAAGEVQTAQSDYDTKLIPEPGQVDSERVPGVRADVYNGINASGNAIPPRGTDYNFCKTVTLDQISADWGGGDILGCGYEFVMIHYTGYLTVPETTEQGYYFYNIADDGWYFTLDGVLVNDNWTLKGCSGWWSEGQPLVAGRSYVLDAWFYEWGGGACSTLYYDNGMNWGVVPASWYSQNKLHETTYMKDPALLAILQEKQTALETVAGQLSQAQLSYDSAYLDLSKANQERENAIAEQQQIVDNNSKLRSELTVALENLASVPKYVPEPVVQETPEPSPAPQPEETVEPIATPEPVLAPPTDAEIVAELMIEAQADDIVIDEQLAAVPVLGQAVVAIADAINYLGNAGADMTPEVRAKSKKVIVSAVIVTQIAAQAAVTATMAASAVNGSSTTTGRRR